MSEKKSVSPGLAVAVIVVLIALVAVLFWKQTSAKVPPAAPGNTMGMPGAGMPGPGMPGPGMPGPGGRPGMPGAGMPGAGMPGAGMPGAGMPGPGRPGMPANAPAGTTAPPMNAPR